MNTPFLRLIVLLTLSASAFGTTAVTGHIARLDTTTPGATAYVRFWLRGTRGNQPRITGTGAIAPQFSGSTFYVDLPADASGNISGTIYSTRDATGIGAGDIEAGGSYTAVYYGMQIVNGGIPGPEIPVHARSGGTLDIANVSPISTLAVVTAPTGDTTYARLDGGNTPFSGAVSFGSTINATHGGSLGGTFTGNPIFSGTPSFSGALGTLSFSNAGVFTNTQMNDYVTSSVNSLNIGTEFSTAQGGNFATEGFASGVAVPGTANIHQINGIAGYANTNVVSSPLGSNNNTVGGYFQCRGLHNNSACWGSNQVSIDTVGLTGHELIGDEVDVNVFGTPTEVWQVLLNGINTGTMPAAPLPGNGTVFNAAAMMYLTTGYPTSTQPWPAGVWITRGAVNGTAFHADANCFTGACASEIISLTASDSGNTAKTSTLQADITTGALALLSPSGAANRERVGAFSTLPTCAAGTEGSHGGVTDSTTATWGATITGGGANHVYAYCDGANWTVAGK